MGTPLVVLLLLLAAPTGVDLGGLTDGARDLARAGWGEESGELLGQLVELGLPETERKKLESEIERAKDREREPPGSKKLARVATRIRRGVERAAESLPADPQERRRVAGILVRIDASCEGAQKALGRRKVEDDWLDPDELRRWERAAKFQEELRRARHLEVELNRGKPDPIIAEATGRPGETFSGRNVEYHGPHEAHQAQRILREAFRAAAVQNWLLTDRLEVPSFHRSKFLQLRTEEEYLAALDAALERGRIDRQFLRQSTPLVGNMLPMDGLHLYFGYSDSEADSEAMIIDFLFTYLRFEERGDPYFDEFQPCLQVGLTHLVCLAFLGTGIPKQIWTREEGEQDPETVGGKTRDRSRLVTLFPQAGLIGHRRRMVYLVREGREPAWASTMLDQVGRIQGDLLIKATSMVEFLAEDGPLLGLCLATRPRDGQPAVRIFEEALGESIESVEARWKRWLLGEEELSLVERLGATRFTEMLPEGAEEALEHLNRFRVAAGQVAAGLDPELCRGALAHARYLNLNPEQLSMWPEAHEEFPDKPGFSPAGAWAGPRSVISPGSSSPRDAIDAWMATFYHRLPLLQPGLLFIGWGEERGTAVLDADSLAMPPEAPTTVVWPPDGRKDVPPRFQPEVPNPVPGEDQGEWGHPVTVQTWAGWAGLEQRVTLELHEGREGGALVDCWLSTPSKPTNPEIVPANAWCLIPKRALRSNSLYTAVARILLPEPGDKVVWSFRTGTR